MASGEVFDRSTEDLGNIVHLEHVNLGVPDQGLATAFYVSGLGLTRDPAMRVGVENMWVNIGSSQFHLPTGPAVVSPGSVTGIVLPSFGELEDRLARVQARLAQTRFEWKVGAESIDVTCPWGNRIRCHAPNSPGFRTKDLALAYVSLDIELGLAKPIARFYEHVMRAIVTMEEGSEGERARIVVGRGQSLVFEERRNPGAISPQHHIQIYIADFSGPHRSLRTHNADIEESNRFQYRFRKIFDSETGRPLLSFDHEIRSMTHPMYGRALINRNPGQANGVYIPGQDFH